MKKLILLLSLVASQVFAGYGDGSYNITSAAYVKTVQLVPAGAMTSDLGNTVGEYLVPTVIGAKYWITPGTAIEFTQGDINGAVITVNSPGTLVTATATTIDIVYFTLVMPVDAQVTVATNTFYGTFTGGSSGGLVQSANNGSDFADAPTVRANLHALVTDDATGTLGLQDSTLYLGYGRGASSGSSDSLMHVRSLATSPNNSGGGFNTDIMGVDPATGLPVLIDPVGAALVHVPTNRIGSLAPGNWMLVGNRDTSSMKNLLVCGPGIPGYNGLYSGDSGNFSIGCFSFVTGEFSAPFWQRGCYQPGDKTYTFTVSGISVTPVMPAIYTNNNQRFTVNSSSLVAGSGTILMTSSGTPTASGTLRKVTGAGDAIITFTAQVTTSTWIDAFKVNPGSAYVSIYSNLYVTNIVTAYNGIQFKEGSNARMGTATLNGTTAVVIANTSVTANSRIMLTINLGSGTVGSPYVSARSANTSFSIKSTIAGDTSTVAWVIYEPGS